jgi:hypothetical protein
MRRRRAAGLTAVTHWWLGGSYERAIAAAGPYAPRAVKAVVVPAPGADLDLAAL